MGCNSQGGESALQADIDWFDSNTFHQFILKERYIYRLYINGKFPNNHIDHDRTNNKISNLRLVSSLENSKNKSLYKNNKSETNGEQKLE